jgi:hypothetical protein
LDISQNAITGSIPHAWSWLRSDGRPSLQHLSLDKNQLIGTLPPWLPVAFPHLKANGCAVQAALLMIIMLPGTLARVQLL